MWNNIETICTFFLGGYNESTQGFEPDALVHSLGNRPVPVITKGIKLWVVWCKLIIAQAVQNIV